MFQKIPKNIFLACKIFQILARIEFHDKSFQNIHHLQKSAWSLIVGAQKQPKFDRFSPCEHRFPHTLYSYLQNKLQILGTKKNIQKDFQFVLTPGGLIDRLGNPLNVTFGLLNRIRYCNKIAHSSILGTRHARVWMKIRSQSGPSLSLKNNLNFNCSSSNTVWVIFGLKLIRDTLVSTWKTSFGKSS